jgi:glycosyltransferase involved in cell wall biosynthesis
MVAISIIIPTYNRRNLIRFAIDSVLSQTWTDYELIIVDDGSTDSTGEFIDRNFEDSRIKYFYQANKGQNFARNLGISKASGEYLCFLDSDDLWPEYKLEMSLTAFKEHPDCDVVFGYEILIDDGGNELGRSQIKPYSGQVTAKLIVDNFVGMSAAMVRTEAVRKIGGMDETIKVADDFALWLNLSRCCRFYYMDKPLGYYRITSDQISKDTVARLNSNLYTVKKFLEKYPDVITNEERRNALCEFYSKRVRILGKERLYKQGMLEFCKAVVNRPGLILPWRALYRMFIE